MKLGRRLELPFSQRPSQVENERRPCSSSAQPTCSSSLNIREQVSRTGGASNFKGRLGGLNTNFWIESVYFKVMSEEYMMSKSILSSFILVWTEWAVGLA